MIYGMILAAMTMTALSWFLTAILGTLVAKGTEGNSNIGVFAIISFALTLTQGFLWAFVGASW